jgi:hypothetical protein
VEKVPVLRVAEAGRSAAADVVAKEFTLTIAYLRISPHQPGVKLANDCGVTLTGFVRGKRMNVYTNDWRLAGRG